MNEAIVSAYCSSRSRCSLRAGYATTSLPSARFWSSRPCASFRRPLPFMDSAPRGVNRRSRPYTQQGARKLRRHRCHGRLVFPRRQASYRTGIFAVRTGSRPVRIHEQCGVAQPDDAACHQGRQQRKASLFALSHAPVLRFSAGRADHSDRNSAQHHNLRFSAGSGGRIISHVRLYAGRSVGRHLRTAVHLLRRLASHSITATASQPVGCYRHRGLHGGSAGN